MRRKREQLYNLRSRQQAEQQKAEAGITVAVTATATEAIVEEEPEAMAEAEESDSESSISGTGEDRNTVSEILPSSSSFVFSRKITNSSKLYLCSLFINLKNIEEEILL